MSKNYCGRGVYGSRGRLIERPNYQVHRTSGNEGGIVSVVKNYELCAVQIN